MIPQEVISRILDEDIVKIIDDEGIELKKEGANWKCCCPFHNEKTPSLIVSPTKNMWHCFGCHEGGNAISFVMKYKSLGFIEAVEYLAEKRHIQYEKKELTPEEREAQFKREKLININRVAWEFFRASLESSPGAKEFCKKRGWNEKTLEDYGVGYAPAGNSLLKYLADKGWKDEKVFLEAGIVKRNEERGTLYDTFRERIIFPIYDGAGIIRGFSGRYVGVKDDVAKYLNTGETPIYQKRNELFGLHQARRKISSTGTAVLVEGNPDVIRLHQIGVENAVAPLGTALTDEQIKALKRAKAITAVLIGDTDKAGIKAVISHGEQLIKKGLSVRVIELPEGKDPDEFFMTHTHEFEELLTKANDYLPWLAKLKMTNAISQAEISEVIKELCQIMAHISDENVVDMYITQFSKDYKYGSIWKAERYKAKSALEREQIKEQGSEEMMQEYGFYIKNNCYFCPGEKGGDRRWSNFILKPILHIRDEKNAKRVFQMVNDKGQEAVVKFNQSELVSFTDFKTRTESAGNYVWEAGQPELTILKKHLYNNTASADEIKQLGWQKKHGFFAWGNGGLDNGTFEKVDKYGIMTIGGKKYYLPGCAMDTQDNTQGYQFERKFVYTETNDITMRDFSNKLITVFGDNAKVGLAFLLATLFKDIIVSITTSFPILNLFGPKGTGKTEMGSSLMSFFIPNNKAVNVNNATKAGLAEAVAEVSNALVHLDEYKNNMDLDRREFLKGLWDGAGRSKMDMDNDKKRVTTSVDCGVIMSGQEMPTADIALFNRLIFLTFAKSEFTDQERRNFEDLMIIEKRGLTHLTAEILRQRNYFQANFRENWDAAVMELNDRVRDFCVEDRTLRNWAIVLSAYRTLAGRLDIPMSYEELLNVCSTGCADQNAKTKQNNELSGFWDILDILVSSSKIWIDVDYKIQNGGDKEYTIKEGNKVQLSRNKTYLFINFKRISQLYTKEAKEGSGKSIPAESLRFYLEHSSEFMGTMKSMRFKMIDNASGYINSQSVKSKVTSAMIFDYDAIKEHYNIDINIDMNTEQLSESSAPSAAPEIPKLL